MARLVFGMNQSLDGYVDHMRLGPPDLEVFRHWIERVRNVTGSAYGRKMYEIMRYWDQDQPAWQPHEREFAAAWRKMPKWVFSKTLSSVGPNATLVRGDAEEFLIGLKAEQTGEISVSGPNLVGSLVNTGLIDEYRLYVHPMVLGSGQPLFVGPRPRLHLVSSEQIGAEVVKLTYVPA